MRRVLVCCDTRTASKVPFKGLNQRLHDRYWAEAMPPTSGLRHHLCHLGTTVIRARWRPPGRVRIHWSDTYTCIVIFGVRL